MYAHALRMGMRMHWSKMKLTSPFFSPFAPESEYECLMDERTAAGVNCRWLMPLLYAPFCASTASESIKSLS